MKNCTFLDNNAIYGGALYFYDGAAIIENCSFINNEANYGGAIYYLQVLRCGCLVCNNDVNEIRKMDGEQKYIKKIKSPRKN